jgi:hypothetical protein
MSNHERISKEWKHPDGTITRFSGRAGMACSDLFTQVFPEGTREIEVGGPEDVNTPPSCEHLDCFGEHTMAVLRVHVQGPWDCGKRQVGPDGIMQVRQPDGQESGWYHSWMCFKHVTEYLDARENPDADDLCNCPGTDKAHEKCNCPTCSHGEWPECPSDVCAAHHASKSAAASGTSGCETTSLQTDTNGENLDPHYR